MTKADIIAELIKEMPHAKNRMIARILNKRHRNVFPSVESARTQVRGLRGALGTVRRRVKSYPDCRKELGWQAMMPTPIVRDLPPIQFPTGTSVFMLSDIHVPYHDPAALHAAIEEGVSRNPKHVYLNGDLMEQNGVSHWNKDPRTRDTKGEFIMTRQVLAMIRKAFPKAQIWYKMGNHEDWWERHLMQNAPVLLDVPEFQLSKLLNFDALRIKEVASGQFVHMGKLTVIHGHELPKGLTSSVNPARGLYLKFGVSAICGHFHQASEHTESSGYPKRHVACWSLGCLCDLSPPFARINKWGHGAAHIEIAKDGTFAVEPIKIIDGKIY